MAIFGMNGLKFLGLDFLILFAIYGTKIATLTAKESKEVYRVVQRKAMAASTDKMGKAGIVKAYRDTVLAKILSDTRYKDMDPKFLEAYGKKQWLR